MFIKQAVSRIGPEGHRLGKKGQLKDAVHELNFSRTYKVDKFKIKI